jgi:folate-dependent phosphoribosylglycinamide formyltransferase PurN
MKKLFIFFVALISTATNLFSALQDFSQNKKFQKKTITLTINTKQKKTVLEKAKENKLRTAAGAYAGIVALLSPIALAERNYHDKKQRVNLPYSCAGTIILACLSYYLLQPIFNDEINDTPQEQNNNQH